MTGLAGTALHVTMHYIIMVKKTRAEAVGAPSLVSLAIGNLQGLTGHIALGAMALMFIFSTER